MKIFGWILIVIGVLAGFGMIVGGQAPTPFVNIIIGAVLIHKAKQKEEEQKEKENWEKGDKQ